ncbi:Uma2 family endonuclease [Floridanema evergladense]|uniref:Uma2 family endonuclease n=1 Tax=Floridaenema evergladense BLCC-F167 TaxID=3153639 RepID=A0ABV4WN64_9CYAN
MSQSVTSEPILEPIVEEIQFPPGDLWSDEPPLESDLHRDQIELLIRLLKWWWRDRQDFYVTGNLTIYYSPNQRKSEYFRGPDFFVVLGTEKKDRRSWVVWQEDGKYPHVIVELLSNSTAAVDKGLKKQIYQDNFRTLDYFWFHPDTLEFKGFHLVEGEYQEIAPNEQGWLWSQQLQLFLGIHQRKLRFFTAEGNLIPLPEEEMQQEADQERQRAEQAEQELERLRTLLRSQGVEPENL